MQDSRFVRVDSDTVDNLIQKDDKIESVLSEKAQEGVKWAFQGIVPEDKSYWVTNDAMRPEDMPVIITRDEFMRRMKDMSEFSGGTGYYGDLPDNYKVIINTNHPIIVDLSEKIEKKTITKRKQIDEKLEAINKEKSALDEKLKKFEKDEDKPAEDKLKLEEIESNLTKIEEEKIDIYKDFGKKQKIVSQLFDLALLSNNLLKGEPLSNFVTRSVELLKK